jgi:hypothetical protein
MRSPGNRAARLRFSSGIIALDSRRRVWVAANQNQAPGWFAPFDPATGNQLGAWQDLTGGVVDERWKRRHVLGLWFYRDDLPVFTAHDHYNGDQSHDRTLGIGGASPSWGWRFDQHSQATAGFLWNIGGDRWLVGLAGSTNNQKGSHGPVAWEFRFDPDNPPRQDAKIGTVKRVFHGPGIANRHPAAKYNSRCRGFIVTKNYAYWFGQVQTGRDWYGPGKSSAEGVVDPCSSNKGRHTEGIRAYYWRYRLADWQEVDHGPLNDPLSLPGPCTRITGAAYLGNGRAILATDDYEKKGKAAQPLLLEVSVEE